MIESVDATSGIGRRLLDLGFIPSTSVRTLRRAPLGDPASYELRGTQICLRESEALRILVRPGADADSELAADCAGKSRA